MSATVEDRPTTTAEEESRLPFSPHSAIAVIVAVIGVAWPGGRVPGADTLFMIAVLGVLISTVLRHPSVKELTSTVPRFAKMAGTIVLAAFLLGQLWGNSEQSFPVATWTMYSNHPGETASVYRFDAVSASGEPVAFTPSASNRTLPAKMALVHLRRLAIQVHTALHNNDAEHLAEAEDNLRRAILVYIDLYNEQSSGPEPVQVDISRVTYDLTQDSISIDSGERQLLMQIDVEAS